MLDKDKKELKDGIISIFERFNVLDHTIGDLRNDILKYINSIQEEPVSDDFEEALTKEWKGYNDRGAATVDALEDNTQELTFAKGFYRGAKWKNEQMMAKAIEKVADYTMSVPSIHMSLPLGVEVGDKVKVIVIKDN